MKASVRVAVLLFPFLIAAVVDGFIPLPPTCAWASSSASSSPSSNLPAFEDRARIPCSPSGARHRALNIASSAASLGGMSDSSSSSSSSSTSSSSPSSSPPSPSSTPPSDAAAAAAAAAAVGMVTGGIKLERVKNIRDLSSVRGSGIKAGRIYRTGYLSKASEEDIKFIRETAKFKTLIDLRSEKELGMDDQMNSSATKRGCGGKNAETVRVDPSPAPSTGQTSVLQRHFISVIDEGIYQRGVFKRLAKRKKAAALFLITGGAVSKRARRRARSIFLNYINDAGLPLLNDLLLNYSGPALRRVLELLSDKERYPIALYCTAGKDRTGLVILLLLASLGVDSGAIAEDYVLSDTAYADLSDAKAMVGALEQVNNLDPEKFLRAPRSVIEHTLAYIEKKFGSIEGYLDQIGFTEDKRVALKKALREG
ncbi:Tyrosine-protein phosphatase family, C-terminal domain protein [Nannochloropsis gaditana]|uniref:Tyrosine-protein phosphatase family, C-terminal domain protein n=1 Tax=Nannochloropsis gaditana TaxID=72520 RepID=W7TPH7_9STRA|nr:Tyrosine-protein phosphatase family, C-terminal domain protein [Nannochloropsis gaditana]